MLSTGKVTTQAWSKAPQESSLKGDPNKKVGANLANPFGEKNIGDIANEVADPGWVDPAKAQRERKTDLDKDAFFKLMLTQMKNQDPTSPMASHEMAAQLAQFTSMEQLFNINKNLEGIKQVQEPQVGYEAVNFIGKSIVSDSSRVIRTPTDKVHDLRFDLKGDASEVMVFVKDSNNQPVRTINGGMMKKGINKVTWTGLDSNELKTREGEYIFSIEAKNSAGKKVGVETSTSGKITGVNFTPKGPILMIGDQSVQLSDVKKIEDLDLKKASAAQEKSAVSHGLPVMGKAPVVAPPATNQAPAMAPPPGNLQNLNMESGLKNTIDKEKGII